MGFPGFPIKTIVQRVGFCVVFTTPFIGVFIGGYGMEKTMVGFSLDVTHFLVWLPVLFFWVGGI